MKNGTGMWMYTHSGAVFSCWKNSMLEKQFICPEPDQYQSGDHICQLV